MLVDIHFRAAGMLSLVQAGRPAVQRHMNGIGCWDDPFATLAWSWGWSNQAIVIRGSDVSQPNRRSSDFATRSLAREDS